MSLKIETTKMKKINKYMPLDLNYQSNLKFFLHELLNPLNIISNCAELIDSNDKVTTPQFINIILQQVEQCNCLSQNMLSHLIQKQENSINLCHFLIEIRDKFETNFSTNIDLQLNVNCQHINLKFNQVYLKIILDNILKNAYHCGGKIDIILEKKEDDYKILIKNSKMTSKHSKMNDKYGDKMIDSGIDIETELNNCKNELNNCKTELNNCKNELNNCNYRSNMVGLELINNLCAKMDIDWNLFEEEDYYKFILTLNKNRNN
jgi:hypothetical protein